MMDLGNYQTREDAIAGGKANVGEGEGAFVVMEAVVAALPPLDADDVIKDYLEWLGDQTDYYSSEGGGPEWSLSADKQKEAEAELLARHVRIDP